MRIFVVAIIYDGGFFSSSFSCIQCCSGEHTHGLGSTGGYQGPVPMYAPMRFFFFSFPFAAGIFPETCMMTR
ncbi:hypothetical protein F5Y19DRAFT_449713 [Xylariaceae sp. FL1651]|nr:hypothetical protein F5Y19DRAFT_449713 [Xylariaceae sp. FL1651]